MTRLQTLFVEYSRRIYPGLWNISEFIHFDVDGLVRDYAIEDVP